MKSEKGVMLIEAIMAMALLGIIAVTLLAGTATAAKARTTADERSAAKVLAETVIEEIKKLDYAPAYSLAVAPEFAGYNIEISVASIMLNSLQRVSVAVEHRGRVVLTLESYKSNR
jgi:Tfp pilus assembly protein PilV